MNLWLLRVSKQRKRLRIEALKQWANITDEEDVLDLGGALCPITSKALVVDLIKPTGDNNWIQQSLDDVDFQHKFDVVVFSASLYYSKNPLALLKKARKWLRADGKLVIAVDVLAGVKVKDNRVMYSWTEETLKHLLVAAGYSEPRFIRFKTRFLSLPLFSKYKDAGFKRIFCEVKVV